MAEVQRLVVMQDEEAQQYMKERPIRPRFYAGALAIRQMMVVEEDDSLTLLHYEKGREPGARKFDATYGLQLRGVEYQTKRLHLWKPAWHVDPADAIPGQRLVLQPNYKSGKPFPSEPLTKVLPGIQHMIDGLGDHEREIAVNLLQRSLEDRPPEP